MWLAVRKWSWLVQSGSYFDLESVSEWSLELRGENEGICSVGTASVCEGDVVDIEIDSGAEVSCLPSNIGADTYPLLETRLSMCGDHHVGAGGGKLHELGARIMGLETDDVRGNMVNLLVRFRVMEIGKALLSTQDLSRCGWETVFPAGCGDAYSHHAREETVCRVLESQTQASP